MSMQPIDIPEDILELIAILKKCKKLPKRWIELFLLVKLNLPIISQLAQIKIEENKHAKGYMLKEIFKILRIKVKRKELKKWL